MRITQKVISCMWHIIPNSYRYLQVNVYDLTCSIIDNTYALPYDLHTKNQRHECMNYLWRAPLTFLFPVCKYQLISYPNILPKLKLQVEY